MSNHFDAQGRPVMVEITDKPNTARRAIARALIAMQPATRQSIQTGGGRKGDVLQVATLAGIQAGKHCSHWIPLCHPIPLDSLSIHFHWREDGLLECVAEAATFWRTGVEMEAMTAVSAAALTVYDMVKGIDRWTEIRAITLMKKEGGKQGSLQHPEWREGKTTEEADRTG
ncbi:MAG: cyclic pyranopterin monophosphate synthase MoaC [Pirellulaceae bacterium]|jgi:cyclic pyranopterin phosphate synthase